MQTQLVLVGIVPRKSLWPLIQKEKWYHIPVEAFMKLQIPDIVSVKYIAFYFSSIFNAQYRYKVMYYAKITRVEIKKRIALFPDEPTHKNVDENYYQFYLEKIEKLPQPIVYRMQRKIIHIPSNTQKLFEAKEINDLWSGNPLEDEMYQALKKKKIMAERQFFIEVGEEKYYLDFGIFCRQGNIDVECDGIQYHTKPASLDKDRRRNNQLSSIGWHILRFSSQEIWEDMAGCLSIIERTMKSLGGMSIMQIRKN